MVIRTIITTEQSIILLLQEDNLRSVLVCQGKQEYIAIQVFIIL